MYGNSGTKPGQLLGQLRARWRAASLGGKSRPSAAALRRLLALALAMTAAGVALHSPTAPSPSPTSRTGHSVHP